MDKKKKSLIIGARLLIIIGILGAVLLWGYLEDEFRYIYTDDITTTNSTFEYYNGKTVKEIRYDKDEEVTVSYDIEVKEGSLSIVIEDNDGNKVFSKHDGSGEEKIKFNKEEIYKVKIVADKAKGRYSFLINGK